MPAKSPRCSPPARFVFFMLGQSTAVIDSWRDWTASESAVTNQVAGWSIRTGRWIVKCEMELPINRHVERDTQLLPHLAVGPLIFPLTWWTPRIVSKFHTRGRAPVKSCADMWVHHRRSSVSEQSYPHTIISDTQNSSSECLCLSLSRSPKYSGTWVHERLRAAVLPGQHPSRWQCRGPPGSHGLDRFCGAAFGNFPLGHVGRDATAEPPQRR